ncbi:MAG: CPBP family intramembrane metalloprotease [Puniceicoccales bacterium]|jgi:membrane protease YdiL (CAAX protease family)|nr:CPBP family intramembrane metalloprotease [Puniceicoccales bacterium]
MFIELCIKTCTVAFIVVCVLHRLNIKPSNDIGVKALNVGVGQFICVGVLFEIFSMAVQILLEFLAKVLKFEKTDDVSAIICCLTSLIIIFVAIKLFRMFHEEIMRGTRPFSKVVKSAIYNLGLFLPILLGVHVIWGDLLMFVQSLVVHIDLVPQDVVQMFYNPSTTLATIVRVITAIAIAPILEEIIFRGFIYRVLKGRGGKFVAASLTSFIFALIHWNLSAFVGLFTLGMCLTRIYEHGADMREPILVHALFNATTIFGILLDSNVSNV